MRPLLIDAEVKKRIKELVLFAQGDIYWPGKSETVPGDDARHVMEIFDGFRCVFSLTASPQEELFRHLSISVKGKNYPNPIAACTIASEFGFTGWELSMGERPPSDWLLNICETDHCVILAQKAP